MKRTKMWWSHLTKDEKTELVLTERAFPYGFARGERYRELVDKADRAEATRQAASHLYIKGGSAKRVIDQMVADGHIDDLRAGALRSVTKDGEPMTWRINSPAERTYTNLVLEDQGDN